jgi:hypothetical protein
VYEQVARDNDLLFAIDRDFPVLDSLPPMTLARCYPLALATPDLSPTVLRYLRAVYEMKQVEETNNTTPGAVAQVIVDNLQPEDFDDDFLRVAALLTFYLTSSPPELLPKRPYSPPDSLQWAVLSLTANNTLRYNNQDITPGELPTHLMPFIGVDPQQRGVVLIAVRKTSYNFYREVYDSVMQVYQKLEKQKAQALYHQPLDALSEPQREVVEQAVPRYIRVPKPEN